MNTIKIFVASSEELKQERLELADLVEHLNHTFSNQGIQLQLEKWEYLDSSMGPSHKQDEYNKVLETCEICLVLYWTRFGKFTKTELDLAYKNLCLGKNPRKLYVYFKNSNQLSPELEVFKDSFIKDYGHFICRFDNVDTLKADFLLQLMDYMNAQEATNPIKFKDSKLLIKGQEYANLTNVPFATNNQEYTFLQHQVEELRTRLAVMTTDDPMYAQVSQELEKQVEHQRTIETNLCDTALMVTRLRNTKCSERLQRAIELFTNGDTQAASLILNDDEIQKDAEHNITLINLGKEAAMHLKTNLDECKFKIKMLQNEMSEGWSDKVNQLYLNCLKWGRNNVDEGYLAETITEYVSFLNWQGLYTNVENLSLEAVNLYEKLIKDNPIKYNVKFYDCLHNLILYYINSEEDAKAEEIIQKAFQNVDEEKMPERKPILLTQLAIIHERRLQYGKAEQELYQAITILEDLTPDTYNDVLADALRKLAILYFNQDKLKEATKLAERSLKVLQTITNLDKDYINSFKASVYELIGDIYMNDHKFKEAETAYVKYKELTDLLASQNLRTHRKSQAQAYANLSNVNAQLNQYEDAIENSLEAVHLITGLYKEYPKQYATDYGELLFDQANIMVECKNFDQAERLLNEAIAVYTLIADTNQKISHIMKARVYNALANVIQRKGEIKQARKLFIKALAIRKQVCKKYGKQYNEETVQTLNDLGNLELQVGNYEEAHSNFKEALVTSQRLKEKYGIDTDTDMATNYYNLGCTCLNMYRLADSMNYFKKAVELFKNSISNMGNRYNRFYISKSYASLAEICCLQNDFKGWSNYLLEAIKTLEELADENPDCYNDELSNSCYTYAHLLYLLKQHEQALPYAERSVKAATEIDLTNKACKALHLVSCIKRELGDYKEAQTGFFKCMDLWEKIYADNTSLKSGNIAIEMKELAKLYSLMGIRRKAKQMKDEAKEIFKKVSEKDLKTFQNEIDD